MHSTDCRKDETLYLIKTSCEECGIALSKLPPLTDLGSQTVVCHACGRYVSAFGVTPGLWHLIQLLILYFLVKKECIAR